MPGQPTGIQAKDCLPFSPSALHLGVPPRDFPLNPHPQHQHLKSAPETSIGVGRGTSRGPFHICFSSMPGEKFEFFSTCLLFGLERSGGEGVFPEFFCGLKTTRQPLADRRSLGCHSLNATKKLKLLNNLLFIWFFFSFPADFGNLLLYFSLCTFKVRIIATFHLNSIGKQRRGGKGGKNTTSLEYM